MFLCIIAVVGIIAGLGNRSQINSRRKIYPAMNARQIAIVLETDSADLLSASFGNAAAPSSPAGGPAPAALPTQWLRGVDAQGRPTSEYDSATILNALLDEQYMTLDTILPFDALPPKHFEGDLPSNRIRIIRRETAYDLALPADPSRWCLARADSAVTPLLVQRVEYAYDADMLVVAFMDGHIEWMPIAHAEALVVKHTGKTLAQLREPNALAANAADAIPVAPDADHPADAREPLAAPVE